MSHCHIILVDLYFARLFIHAEDTLLSLSPSFFCLPRITWTSSRLQSHVFMLMLKCVTWWWSPVVLYRQPLLHVHSTRLASTPNPLQTNRFRSERCFSVALRNENKSTTVKWIMLFVTLVLQNEKKKTKLKLVGATNSEKWENELTVWRTNGKHIT